MTRIIISLVFCLVAGLASPAVAQPGRAQTSVAAPAAVVKSHLMNEMLSKGFSIISDTPNMVVFDRQSDNFAANLFFGTPYGGAPHYRVAFSMAELNGSTRVFADIALVGNAGSAFERRTDFNQGNDLQAVQMLLDRISIAAAPPVSTATVTAPTISDEPWMDPKIRAEMDAARAARAQAPPVSTP